MLELGAGIGRFSGVLASKAWRKSAQPKRGCGAERLVAKLGLPVVPLYRFILGGGFPY